MNFAEEQNAEAHGSTAVKVLHVIDASIQKIRIIGFLGSLKNQLGNFDLTKEIHEAVGSYNDLSTKFLHNIRPVPDLAADSDHLLYLIKKGSFLNWEQKLTEAVSLSENIADLCSNFDTFRSIVHEIFTQSAKEWNEEEKFFKKYSKVSSMNAILIAKLENELPAAKASRDKAIEEKESLVCEIKDSIDRVERFADGEITFLRENSKLKMDAIESKSKETLKGLELEKKDLEKEVQEAMVASLPVHMKLKERVANLKKCISWIIDKYDLKMLDLQRHFDYVWHEFSFEMEKSRSLCIHYIEVKKSADVLRIENRRILEEKLKKRLDTQLKLRAAVVIQRYWRKFIARHRHKPVEKKGKKKKGKAK